MRNKLFTFAMIMVVCFATISLIGDCDTGLVQRNRVVMIGDSIFAPTGPITRYLQNMPHQEYRDYANELARLFWDARGANDIEQDSGCTG